MVEALTPLAPFSALGREHDFEPLRVEGTLPAGLEGTLFRNGPGRFESHGRRYDHWFDGDGLITAARFRRGRCEGAARFVATSGLVEERRQGRALFGGYGTRSPRGAIARFMTSDRRGIERLVDAKNTANTSVMIDQGRLLAMWEGGRPTALQPETLRTLGDSALHPDIRTFSAHPHAAVGRRATYNVGVRYGLRTELDVFERAEGQAFRKIGHLRLPGATLVHDFAVTARHIVVHAAPLRLGLLRTALNLGSASENLDWRPELGGELLVAPLDDLSAVRRIPTEPRFVWHFANAHEDDAGRITADLVAYDDFSSNELFSTFLKGSPRGEVRGHLTRVTIEPGARRASWARASDTVADFPVVAPGVSGARHRYVYLAGHRTDATRQLVMSECLVKVDAQSEREEKLTLGEGHYPSEALFVPRPGASLEDDGWLLTLVYDARAHTSYVAVIDARRLGEGPIATAWFDQHVPPTIHGTWWAISS